MAQTAKETPAIETIEDPALWRTVCDGVNTVGFDEGVFEFRPDQFRVIVKDAANVAMLRQSIDADVFEHYDVEADFLQGLNTVKFDDLLKAANADVVEFGWDWEDFRWSVQAAGIDAKIAGIDTDSVNGSPVDEPDADKDKYDYTVFATLPVDEFKRASDVVDMAGEIATFLMGGEDEKFEISVVGDTDEYTIELSDKDGFEWREDPPEQVVECRQSNVYIQELVGLLDEDTVRFVSGEGLPFHLWTTRNGVVDTHYMQAPRVDSNA